MKKYEFHEISNIFPMMSLEEKAELKTGMKQNGYDQSHPIWIYQGKILDGRNRYEVAIELGIEPFFAEYNGDNPVGFSVQENLHRRHLTTGQKAIIAARIVPLFEEEARKRMLSGIPTPNSAEGGEAIEHAARVAGVGKTSAKEARKLLDEAPELAKQVESGEKSLNEAVQESRGKNVHVSNNSGENEWDTPEEYLNAARVTMGSIDCDPASSDRANQRVKASKYFTKDNDGLKQKWNGNVWLNPPYSQPLIDNFSRAIVDKFTSKEISQACVLVNNATETKWLQRMLIISSCVCFVTGRIKFIDAQGRATGGPLQGQVILYFGNKTQEFFDNFEKFGVILWTTKTEVK